MNLIKEKINYNLINILLESNYQKINKLYKQYHSWQKAIYNINYDSKKYNPEKEYQKLKKLNIELILKQEKNYPALLKEIPFAPYGIYVLGNPNILNEKSVAIVGTRKATSEGKIIAKKFSFELASYNLNIVSGLALGIDSAAHFGALEAEGKTIAVLGSGFFKYLSKNKSKFS
ncbi:MAG: hypothetical protein KatS3mg093_282 [Candidatus Parcubacteria bacterium]|nr:MAG: hypothetical protein KatS3mg093_282 [Candidatus Parcubacteria bacterium]